MAKVLILGARKDTVIVPGVSMVDGTPEAVAVSVCCQRHGLYRRATIRMSVDVQSAARLAKDCRHIRSYMTTVLPLVLATQCIAIATLVVAAVQTSLGLLFTGLGISIIAGWWLSARHRATRRILPQHPELDQHGNVVINEVHPAAATELANLNDPGTVWIMPDRATTG